ncbi:MAG: MurR/RpiR family transcriptional regulator [Faecalicoccus sp.]|nr:MurR/RpiR family transcriptional regulator [Faecalicoccus sp.]
MLIDEMLKDQDDFSDSEKAIANYLIQAKESIKKEGARQIATKAYVAPSSIVRFCQKLGFEGLNDFKEQYLEELNYTSHYFQKVDPNAPFDKEGRNLEVAGKLATLYIETIQDTLSLLNEDVLTKMTELLNKETIYIVTLSAQIGIARAFKEKMMKIGRRVIILYEAHETLYEMENCDPEHSAVLILSYTGESSRCISCASIVLERGVSCAAVTSYGINRLSSMVPCTIHVSSREKLVSNLGNYSFALSVLYVLDVIYSNIFKLDFEANQEKKIASSLREREPLFEQKGRKSDNPLLNE